MERANGGTVTPPWGTDNTTAVPSRIGAALFSVVWGGSAGKLSHIPEESPREEAAGSGGGFQLALADTPELSSGKDTKRGT